MQPSEFAQGRLCTIARNKSWVDVMKEIESYRKSYGELSGRDVPTDLGTHLAEVTQGRPRRVEPKNKSNQSQSTASARNELARIAREDLGPHIERVALSQADVDAGITRTLDAWLRDENTASRKNLRDVVAERAKELTSLRRVLAWDTDALVEEKHLQVLMLSFLQSLLEELLKLRENDESAPSDLANTSSVCDARSGLKLVLHSRTGYTDIGRLLRELLVNHFELKRPLRLQRLTPGLHQGFVRQLWAESEAIARHVVKREQGKKPAAKKAKMSESMTAKPSPVAKPPPVVVGVLTDGFGYFFDVRVDSSSDSRRGRHIHDEAFVQDPKAAILRLMRALIVVESTTDSLIEATGSKAAVQDEDSPDAQHDDHQQQDQQPPDDFSECDDDERDEEHHDNPQPSLQHGGAMAHGDELAASTCFNDWDKVPYEIENRLRLEIDDIRYGRIRLTAWTLDFLNIDRFQEHPQWGRYPPWVQNYLQSGFELRVYHRYRLVRRVKHLVFESFDVAQDRAVIVKLEPRILGEEDGPYWRNESPELEQEFEAYERLYNGRGIPEVHVYGYKDEYYFLVMELLGSSLSAMLESRESLSLAEALDVAIALSSQPVSKSNCVLCTGLGAPNLLSCNCQYWRRINRSDF